MYRDFWRIFVHEYGGLRAAITICFFTIAVSVLEGLNIGLLVPLLENLGSSTGEESHWVSRGIERIFDWLGITFGLKSILLSLGVLTLAMAVLKYVRHLLMVKTSQSFVAWLRARNMWNLLNADLSHFHNHRIGVLTDTLMHQSGQCGGCLIASTMILTNIGLVVAYLVAAFLITPILTAGAVGMLVLVSLMTQYFINQAKGKGTRVVDYENNLSASAVEDLSGVRVIKGFLIERFRWGEFQRKTSNVMEAAIDVNMNAQRMVFIQETAVFALIGILLFVGAEIIGLQLAVLVTLLFVLYRLAPRVATINAARHSLAVSMAALQNVDAATQSTSNPKVISGGTKFAGLNTAIELQGVEFSYEGNPTVLKDLSFTIERGMTTAIVGASGTGKSTIMDMLLRYHDPVRGKVLVDGVDLKELDVASWRSSIGVVSQDIFLFNDTIANNIGLGREGVSQERMIEAAGQAYAHDFITLLPLGYETMVGDRGLNLSGGERQRIALARAILDRPEILILDEATSSLDSESEELIHRYMRQIRGTCTMVVVAHRFSTIQDANKIVVLHDGQIVEEGDWNELVSGDGFFANYHRLQSVSQDIDAQVDGETQDLAAGLPRNISQGAYQQQESSQSESN